LRYLAVNRRFIRGLSVLFRFGATRLSQDLRLLKTACNLIGSAPTSVASAYAENKRTVVRACSKLIENLGNGFSTECIRHPSAKQHDSRAL
jgi:hypothetical protein